MNIAIFTPYILYISGTLYIYIYIYLFIYIYIHGVCSPSKDNPERGSMQIHRLQLSSAISRILFLSSLSLLYHIPSSLLYMSILYYSLLSSTQCRSFQALANPIMMNTTTWA